MRDFSPHTWRCHASASLVFSQAVTPNTTDIPTIAPTQISTPSPQATPHPDGYTLHLYTDGIDVPVSINYWDDLSGKDITSFSLYADTPYQVTMEAGIIDIKEDFTSGYYLWTWDDYAYYGTDETIWGTPIELSYFTLSSDPVKDKKLKFLGYDEPVVLPSPLPTAAGTSMPTSSPMHNIMSELILTISCLRMGMSIFPILST